MDADDESAPSCRCENVRQMCRRSTKEYRVFLYGVYQGTKGGYEKWLAEQVEAPPAPSPEAAEREREREG